MNKQLGTLDEARLANIPEKRRAEHEFCFPNHDSMLRMFMDLTSHSYPTGKFTFETQEALDRFQESPDPITFFLENGMRDVAKEMSVGQAMMAIWGDFFNFIYEALTALEKRKFVVAFALLRKPLKQNLLYLTMILVNDEEFFARLESSPADHLDHPTIQDSHRKDYFKRAKELIPFTDFVDPETLHDIIFDTGMENGLAPLFDKANHLVTRRKQIQTEDLNLNFIFKNPMDDDVFETTYRQLAYILLYALFLQIELFKRAGFTGDEAANWFSLTGLGTYSALFTTGSCSVTDSMNEALEDLMVCPHCKEKTHIQREDAARFFTAHKLTCHACGLEHDFPLLWLLAKTNWSIDDKDGEVQVQEE